ncbi:MAG: PCI domain-containing protein [Thermoplasmatota archaeon]
MKFRSWYLFFIIGLVFLVLLLMFIPVTISAFAEVDGSGSGEVVGIVSTIFCVFPAFILATLFLLLAFFLRKKIRELSELAETLRSYRIITISDLARKMDKNKEVARHAVKQCLKKGFIQGRMDEKEETFYTTEYLKNTPNIINGWRCASCNAENKEIILPGEVGKCSSCGDVLDNRAKDVTTVKGEDILPPEPKKTKGEDEKKPIPPKKIEPPAAVKEMIESARSGK